MNNDKKYFQISGRFQRSKKRTLIYLISMVSSKTESIQSVLIVSLDWKKSKENLLNLIKSIGKNEDFKTEETDEYVKVIHKNENYFKINKNDKRNQN